MNRDLTVGKPARVLWQYCMPLFGSVIFQQLYNLADSFVAGKFIGEEALAAVGIIVSILNQVLVRSGREEQATMTSLAGLVVVLMIVVQRIAELFDLVKTLFRF